MAPGSGSARSVLTSTYFDTPDLALRRLGLALRVRQEAGRFVQTVKAADPGGANVLTRGEWEDAVAANCPDIHAPQSGALLPPEVVADLRPLFVTEVARTVIGLEPSPETRIEAAIDDGEIRVAGSDRADPISEIELELKSGATSALYDLALRLLAVAPIRIGTRSKSERGYRLVASADTAPKAIYAEPVGLDAAMPVEAALQRIGRSCLAHLLRNEAAALDAQPEGVHQMRSAVRRIRSALSSLKKVVPGRERRWVSEQLAWLAGPLGPARNLDVFVTELLRPAGAELAGDPDLEDLADTLERSRRAAYDRVAEQILSERYTAAMLRLLRWFEAGAWRGSGSSATLAAPIGEIAPRLLDRRRRKVRQRSKGFRRQTPRQRHKLRIAVKKLRYAIELLGRLFDPDDLQRYVKPLRRLQDDLGYANDVRVAHDLVAELRANADPESPVARAGARLLEWHDRTLVKGERALREHLYRLNRATPFWRKQEEGGGS